MKKMLLLIPFLVLILASCSNSQDWAKIEADYQKTKLSLENKGYPKVYYSQGANGKILAYDPTPELGVGMHGITQESIDVLKKANIRFVRHTLYWGLMEPAKGVYDEKYVKQFSDTIELCKKNNIILLIVVHQNPPGISFANREVGYERFADFMVWAVKKFPYVRYWQLWNEMDQGFTDLFGGGGVKKADGSDYSMEERGKFYVEMLKIAYPKIKQASPSAVVVCGAIVDWDKFAKSVYANGGKDYFDIMSVHSYGVPLQWGFVTRGAELRETMNKYGDNNKPLWNTEFGTEAGALYSAWGVPSTDPLGTWLNQQKEMLSDCITFNNKSGLYNKCFIYQYAAGLEGNRDVILSKVTLPEGDNIDNYGFGLVKMDGVTPKPIMKWIIDNQPNNKKKLAPKTAVKVVINKKKKVVNLNSSYPTLVK